MNEKVPVVGYREATKGGKSGGKKEEPKTDKGQNKGYRNKQRLGRNRRPR